MCFQNFISWRRISTSTHALRMARTMHTLMAAVRAWVGLVSSEKRRARILLSCAATSIREIRGSLHDPPVQGTKAAGFCRRTLRFSVNCVTLKLCIAEVFALWASKSVDIMPGRSCMPTFMQGSGELQEPTVCSLDVTEVQAFVWRMQAWLVILLKRRLRAARWYQWSRFCATKKFFGAWFLLRDVSKGLSMMHQKLAKSVALITQKMHFTGWTKLIAGQMVEWASWQAIKSKRRVFSHWLSASEGDHFARACSRSSLESSTDYLETSNASSMASSVCASPIVRPFTPGSPVRTKFTPTLQRVASAASDSTRAMHNTIQDTFAYGLDVQELRMDLQAEHEEAAAAKELAQVSTVIAELSQHILSQLQINFVTWKKITVLKIARKKRDKRRIKSMQKKRQRLQVRLCNIWFRAHKIIKDRVAAAVDFVCHNRKRKFLAHWREFHDWWHKVVCCMSVRVVCACV